MRRLRLPSLPRSVTFRLGLAITVLVVLAAIFGEQFAPHDPNNQNLLVRLAPPGTEGHILGTDQYGRDILSRLFVGARISMIVGLGAVGLGSAVGLVLGLLAGYLGGWVDLIIGRVLDILLSFPAILLALALVAALGPSLQNIVLAIGITTSPLYGRVVRASAMTVKNRDFVAAARFMGGNHVYVVVRHVVPNVLSPLLVTATVGIATAILVEATLSFLGIGTPPPTASWGTIVSDGKQFLSAAPWLSAFGGLAIVVAVFGVTLLGDGLRDVLDPKLRR